MRKLVMALAVGLGLIAPAFAFAQTSTTGLLTVYVQVLAQSGYSAFPAYAPSNFTVSVSGNTPSLASFQGSQSGTPVQLYPGSYNVTAASLGGYTPSYSVGCNNTIATGQSQTCVITMTPTYGYYPTTGTTYPYNYSGYPYYGVAPLSCQALSSSAALNQPVTFQAAGGAGGTYNWVAPYTQTLNYPNAGQQLTVAFEAPGQQTVSVTNAAQTASCSVLVTNGYYPSTATTYPYPSTVYPTYPTQPVYTQPTYTPPSSVYYPSYPSLPRTGFGPHDNTLGWVLSAVLLAAAGFFTAPYVRKAFAIVSR